MCLREIAKENYVTDSKGYQIVHEFIVGKISITVSQRWLIYLLHYITFRYTYSKVEFIS